MKKFSAPIIAAMAKYSADGALAFHTPGHKQGLGAHEFLKNLVTAEGLRQEVSLMEELDDLHSPHSCIAEAEKLAAELWHAEDCLFVVNGTTCAIQAMILATLQPGDLIFIPRNSHRSVMAGLILAGAVPIFLPVEFSAELKIPLNLTAETLQRAIKKFPTAKALILTSPNYYGVAADLPKISAMLRAAGMLLLVDEAHGAHLQFSEKLPVSAMDAGADLAAQSTHKILGAMTQTSMLLCKGKFSANARRAASLLQTTSPNYLLLASLDAARLQMAESGAEKISAAVELSKSIRAEINSIGGLSTFDAVENFQLDLTKITVNVEALGLTGIAAEKILRHELKIQCELSDAANLLFLITYADNCATAAKLIEALRKLSAQSKKFSHAGLTPIQAEIKLAGEPREEFTTQSTGLTPLQKEIKLAVTPREEFAAQSTGLTPIQSEIKLAGEPREEFAAQSTGLTPIQSEIKLAVTPREIFFAPKESVALAKSIGKICAEEITFYPPGIPILSPGEKITAEIVRQIGALKEIGGRIIGAADTDLQTIKIVEEGFDGRV